MATSAVITMTQPLNPYQRWVKPRLESDPEFRKKYIQQHSDMVMKRYKNDEEYKKKIAESSKISMRNKYQQDPEYRAKKIEYSRMYYLKKKAKQAGQSP